MTPIFFVSIIQQTYTDSLTLKGPFASLDHAKSELTDDVQRGWDGDETRYVFHELYNSVLREVGYVHFKDECVCDEGDIREEQWYYLDVV